MKQTVVILGAGQMGRAAAVLLAPNGVFLAAYGDNNPDAWDRSGRPPVLPVEEALGTGPDLLLVGVLDEGRGKALEEQARALGYSGPVLRLGDLYGLFDVRAATLRRVARRIQSLSVPGAAAELGVYRGAFAWQLNALFPDRPIYLFDTFEGFDGRDVQSEWESGGAARAEPGDFRDTGLSDVFARLPHPERAVVKKGYFPETARGLDVDYAAVSLDADLFAPTLAGLEYFYPRLSPGGVIFLHDYNNSRFDGVRRAVCRYEAAHGPLPLAPLCDLHGTAVIIRP